MLAQIVFLLLACDTGARRISTATVISKRLEGFEEHSAKYLNVSSQLDTDLNLETVLGGLVPNTASGPALPTSSFMYGFSCPFQEWYPKIPANFGKWEKNLVDGYKETYASQGSPIGIRKNDHNYGTLLGQGNTLGFVTAKLTLGEGPDFTKFGLFAESGTLDAVLRFSDFGADASTTRFTRIALKIPLKTAWGNEVNLLFTETMDTFPISNYGQLGVSLGGGHGSILKNALYGVGFAASAAGVMGKQNFGSVVMGRAFKKETLAKSFYSQLPYALGEKQAMKFSLVPKQKPCEPNDGGQTCCLPSAAKPTNATDALKFARLRAGAIAKFLEECDAEFEMQLQVKQRGFWNDRTILRNGSSSWSESPVKVLINSFSFAIPS